MRLFVYGLLAVPLLALDFLLLSELPELVTRFYSWGTGVPALGGLFAYLLAHRFIRKPERLYLWGHELTHLVVAKLFFRTVHGFHITSRGGGRVVIDGTNVWIDLAPYLFPFYNLLLLALAALLPPSEPWGTNAYLVGSSFLFSMHAVFSAEGFLQGQPDLTRSGRPFSFALVVLFLVGILPLLFAPGTGGGWGAVPTIYSEWGSGALEAGRRLLLSGSNLL